MDNITGGGGWGGEQAKPINETNLNRSRESGLQPLTKTQKNQVIKTKKNIYIYILCTRDFILFLKKKKKN